MVNQAIVTPKRDAVQRACDSCRQHKQKCDGFNPCSRCSHKKVPCEYLSQNRKNYTRVIPEPGAKQNKRGPGPVDGGRRPTNTRARGRRRRGSFKTVHSDDSEEDRHSGGRDDREDDDDSIWDQHNDTDLGGNLDDEDEDDDDDEVEEGDDRSIGRARFLTKKARVSPSLSPFSTPTDLSPRAITKPFVPADLRPIAIATVPAPSCAPSSRPPAPFSPPVQKISYPVHNPYLSPKSNSYNPVTSNARSTIRSLPSISRSSSSTSLAEILLDISSPEYGNVVPLPLYPPSFTFERKHTDSSTDVPHTHRKEAWEERTGGGSTCCLLSSSSSDSIGSVEQHQVSDRIHPTVVPANRLSSPPTMISFYHPPPDYHPIGSIAQPVSFVVDGEPVKPVGLGGTDRDRAQDLFRDFRYLPPIEARFDGRKGQSRV